jgi:trehalose monomycolate/heme transporter
MVRAGARGADRGGAGVGEQEEEGGLMFDRLALLADRRGKTVVIVAVVMAIVAGMLGAGVADRLDPYGADDPATESVKAAERLQDAGYREASVVVLVHGVDVDSAAGRQRIGRSAL